MNKHSLNPIPYIPGLSEKFGITVASSRDDIAYKSYIDYELFYIYLADAMMTYPKVVAFIEDEYDKNKYLYYSKAIGSTQYYATIMSDSSIAQEVMTKRAFGILLAARDNSSLQAKICEVLISTIPVLGFLSGFLNPLSCRDYFAEKVHPSRDALVHFRVIPWPNVTNLVTLGSLPAPNIVIEPFYSIRARLPPVLR